MTQNNGNWFSNLLPEIGNFVQGDVNRMAQSPSPQNAIVGRILQNPGQFAQNAAGGVGNLVKSVAGIPGAVVKSVSQGTEPQDLRNLVGGVGNMYKGIAQDPYGSFIKDPIGTSLAITPAGNVMDAVGDTGKAAVSTGKAASSELPPIQEPVKNPGASKMITNFKAPDDAVANYHSIFQIPRNIAQNMKIKPDQVINQLIDDGVTNVGNLDDLDKVAKSVTGETGAFPTINRIILKGVQQPVDIGDARTAAGLDPNLPSAVDKYLEGSPKGFITQVTNQVKRAMPQTDPVTQTSARASDIFDASQELDKLANMYKRKAYTVMGDLTNPEYERAGQAIQEVSSNLKDSLDGAVPPEQYQAYKNSPEVQQQLQRLPPKIAQRWLDNAKEFRDGRAIQAPYVGLANMVEDTKDAQLSAFTKWTNNMQKQQPSQSIVNNLVHPVQATQNLAQQGLQKVISPLVDKTPEDIMSQKTSGVSATMKPSGALPAIGGSIKSGVQTGLSTLPTIAKSQEVTNNPDNQNNGINPTQPNNNIHTAGSIAQPAAPINSTDIPSDVKQINGQTPITSPLMIKDKTGQPLAISDTDYKDLKKQYQQQLGTLQVKYNPKLSAQIQSQLDQLETTHGQSQELQGNYNNAMDVSNASQTALQMLQNAPGNLFNQNGLVDNYNTLFNGKYAGLKESLGILQKYYPVLSQTFLNSPNPQVAQAVLNQINTRVAQDYYQKINTVTGNVPGAPPTTLQQTAQSQNLQPTDNGGGGAIQATAPMGSFAGLPPIQ